MNTFRNLIDVTTHFSSKETCVEYLTNLRWNGNVQCAHCGHDKVYTLKGKTKRFKCARCRQQFSATVGTIFEKSTISLQKWFVAIYLVTSHKKGISSHQLAKDIGVTQKTAWFMLHRIRFALKTKSFDTPVLGKVVEIDETFVGGKRGNMHAKKREALKHLGGGYGHMTAVLGMVQRGGEVVTQIIPAVNKGELIPILVQTIQQDTVVITDNFGGYRGLNKIFKQHEAVSHSTGEYVRGKFHTNTIESYWSMVQRGIIGIYHQVSKKHLDKYLDEFEFRYNSRKLNEVQRFENMLSLSNTRLTYSNLINHE